MKIKKVIKDLAPYIAAGMVLGSAIAVNKGCSVEGKVEVETETISNCVFPEYNKNFSRIEMKKIKELEIIFLELKTNSDGSREYRVLYPEMIDNIVYSVGAREVVITLKDSELCYLGVFDSDKNKYNYTELGTLDLAETIDNSKVLTKK